MRRNTRDIENGFSLIELLTVMACMGVIIAMAVLASRAPLRTFRVNSAMDQITGQLRSARGMAISQRREMKVIFTSPNQIQVCRQERPAGETCFPVVTLEGTAQYMTFAGVLDTPMAFGNGAAILIGGVSGGPPLMKFTTTGAFINAAGNPINGTIFMGMTGVSSTARAVTILGATGRVRPYFWNGATWFE